MEMVSEIGSVLYFFNVLLDPRVLFYARKDFSCVKGRNRKRYKGNVIKCVCLEMNSWSLCCVDPLGRHLVPGTLIT